ncbi:MAG TPA: sugar transferase [Chitinophaga sp.]|uniref:sugar transferase n=1 Tax=Chitinophaga sp. TaxID=1869181 RepID=UPI002C0A84ED|nr:sugar transferase [Chitinophaga sp.]HVI47682.1 sugar transferase [Chitinophaga sp.]
MNTLTPNLLQVKSIKGTYVERGTTNTYRVSLHPESIVLFVGNAPHDMPESNEQFSYVVAEDTEDARKVIHQLQHVFKKIPAVIIYRYQSSYEPALKVWETYFSTHQFLNTIPFFIYTDAMSDNLTSLTQRYRFIDDVIDSSSWDMLAGKVTVVSKFKRMRVVPVKKSAEKIKYNGRTYSNLLKRSMDIFLAGMGLLLLSPVMLVIAALIRLESKGPIFYAAKRAGRNYRIFKFYKFRTMIPDADKKLQQLKHLNQYDGSKDGPVFFKVSNDPRITKLGHFLRNTSLDELPQLLNVLKGDMSLVGNRPLPLYEATSLTTDEWVERFLAPAGITGLWQVSKRGKKDMSVKERIDLDINYANKRSFRYDIWLIMNTPFALVQKDNV